ncbi:MAG: immunity protein Tsi6 family protein [Endozoicomonas sp.]|uniref:immunity protein Tsi6 family protein n=1 Tax=Endozoicomonas sp. TaxID=1892382 RepID=UPI003D9B91CA
MNLFNDINSALAEVQQQRIENPDYSLWKSIEAQLRFMLNDFDDKGKCRKSANLERVDAIIIGVQAIRELDTGNPQLSDLLCNIDYNYKKIYHIKK